MNPRLWTLVAPGYDRAVGLVGWHRCQDELVADVTSGTVLDIGCGPAYVSDALRDRGVDYVGLDRNPGMLSRAAVRLAVDSAGAGRLVRGEATSLPFAPDSFDFVIATGVLGLLDRRARRRALHEIARVSRGGVRLLEPLHRPGRPRHPLRSRLVALVADGPIEVHELADAGMSARLVGPAAIGGVYSMVHVTVG